jgi:hypothetical protein
MLGDSLIHNVSKQSHQSLYELNFFLTLLQSRPRKSLYLNIPETLIYGFGFQSATLICTDNSSSELVIEEGISSGGVYEIFQFFQEKIESGSPIAVLKTQPRSHDKCKILLTLRDLASAWENRKRYAEGIVIQRFINSGSPVKVAKVRYSLNSAFTSMKIFTRSRILAHLSQALNPLSRASGVRINENSNFLVKKKDLTKVKEEILDYAVRCQVLGLAQAIEKVYSAKKECKVDWVETSWVPDLKGVFFLVNVTFFKILYLVEKELPKAIRHFKNQSEDVSAFRVLFRSKKNVKSCKKIEKLRSSCQSVKTVKRVFLK